MKYFGVGVVMRWPHSSFSDPVFVDNGNAINLKIPSVYGSLDPNGNAHVNLSSNNVVVVLNYWI